jgi:hypothetical protein
MQIVSRLEDGKTILTFPLFIDDQCDRDVQTVCQLIEEETKLVSLVPTVT